MATSPRMRWPYPNAGADPWYDTFEALVTASDTSAFAAFEDRNLAVSGGSDFTFNASTGIISWLDDIVVNSPMSGVPQTLAGPASTLLLDGQFVYVSLVRGNTQNTALTASVAYNLPSNSYDSALVLFQRVGPRIYFRNGAILQDGDTEPVFEENSGGGGAGTVTSVTAGAGLDGGTITTSGTIFLPNVGPGAGPYGGSPNSVLALTLDAKGRVSGASSTAIQIDASQVTSGILSNLRGGSGVRPAAWGSEYLWWRLDDAPQSGSTPNTAANSGSAGAATLTATANPTVNNSNGGAFYDKTPMLGVTGPFSSIARFRGSTNTLKGADAVYTGTTALTLSAWTNIGEVGGSYVCNIATKLHPSGFSVALQSLGGRAYYTVLTPAGAVTYYTAQYLFLYGLPVFLALTYDGSNIRGYLNGQEVVSGPQTGSIIWTTGAGSEWEIGQPFGGIERYDIWDVRVSATVRSAAQLLADYKTGVGTSW